MPTPPKKKLAGKPPSPYSAKPAQPREVAGPKPNPRSQSARPTPRKPTPQSAPQKPARPTPRPAPAAPSNIPFGARISRRASDRLRAGHLWVYSTDIESINASNSDTLLPVADNRGLLMGTALYSPSSQITLRLISRHAIDQAQWLELLASRLRTAIARRKPLLSEDTNACRLVFSEADELPGLIIDKYAGLVIVQLLTHGLDTANVRKVCVQILREEFASSPLTIWERPDPRIRELEGLSAPATTPLFSTDPAAPEANTVFRLNGLSFHFDVSSGQKTGAFLDQRQNYAAAAAWAKVRNVQKALDICTYQGGFALHLAQAGAQVTGVDASRASLEVAERNLALNRESGNVTTEVDWLEADAFELLRAWSDATSDASSQWDLIVLDPPAFAKSKRAVEGALRGYKELNLRALRLLRPGGLLITCSCSHHVTWSDLEGAVASAAVDANRRVTLLERHGAAQDHPVVLSLPETEYLKCLICQVD
jgi:23S rRNA (cytosine1962-C5)-methyltransferase